MPHTASQPPSTTITLPARFSFAAHRDFFSQCDSALAEDMCADLTLDFSAVQHIDSSAIGMMINMSKKAAQQGRGLVIKNPSGDVANILELIKIDALFKQHQTEQKITSI